MTLYRALPGFAACLMVCVALTFVESQPLSAAEPETLSATVIWAETGIPIEGAMVDLLGAPGVNPLQGDPLASLCLTNNVHVEVINALLAFGKPILATGGGGYNVDNTVRTWALVWTVLCGEQADHDATAGMGGVMLESTEWNGGHGLRDRVLIPSDAQRKVVDSVVKKVIEEVKKRIFPIHGI